MCIYLSVLYAALARKNSSCRLSEGDHKSIKSINQSILFKYFRFLIDLTTVHFLLGNLETCHTPLMCLVNSRIPALDLLLCIASELEEIRL